MGQREQDPIDQKINKLLTDDTLTPEQKEDVLSLAEHISHLNELKRMAFKNLSELDGGDVLQQMLARQQRNVMATGPIQPTWHGKKYKLERSGNCNQWGDLFGVNLMFHEDGNFEYPTVELVKNGDEYTFSTSSTIVNNVIKFKEGVEFDEETLDGRTIKNVITFDGNKMIHDRKRENGGHIIIYREFTENDVTTTVECDGIKLYYKAV